MRDLPRFSFVSRRAIHLAHPAFADLGGDFVHAEAGTGDEGQTTWIIRSDERRRTSCTRQ